MKKQILSLLLLLSILYSSHARLGETFAEVNQRYGAPQQDNEPVSNAFSRDYIFNGVKIAVLFLNGKSVSETYKPVNEKRDFADDEIAAILAANSLNSKWKQTDNAVVPGVGSAQEWILESGIATANCNNGFRGGDIIIIQITDSAKEWMRIQDERSAERRARRLKGF